MPRDYPEATLSTLAAETGKFRFALFIPGRYLPDLLRFHIASFSEIRYITIYTNGLQTQRLGVSYDTNSYFFCNQIQRHMFELFNLIDGTLKCIILYF